MLTPHIEQARKYIESFIPDFQKVERAFKEAFSSLLEERFSFLHVGALYHVDASCAAGHKVLMNEKTLPEERTLSVQDVSLSRKGTLCGRCVRKDVQSTVSLATLMRDAHPAALCENWASVASFPHQADFVEWLDVHAFNKSFIVLAALEEVVETALLDGAFTTCENALREVLKEVRVLMPAFTCPLMQKAWREWAKVLTTFYYLTGPLTAACVEHTSRSVGAYVVIKSSALVLTGLCDTTSAYFPTYPEGLVRTFLVKKSLSTRLNLLYLPVELMQALHFAETCVYESKVHLSGEEEDVMLALYSDGLALPEAVKVARALRA